MTITTDRPCHLSHSHLYDLLLLQDGLLLNYDLALVGRVVHLLHGLGLHCLHHGLGLLGRLHYGLGLLGGLYHGLGLLGGLHHGLGLLGSLDVAKRLSARHGHCLWLDVRLLRWRHLHAITRIIANQHYSY